MTVPIYYQDDFVTLYNGNCFDILPTLECKVDMFFVDPPYGNMVRCKWDYAVDLSLLWSELHRSGHKNTAYVFTGAQPFTSKLVMSNTKEFKQELIWRKTQGPGHMNCKRMALKNHENILIFYGSPPVYNPQMTAGKPYTATNNPLKNRVYGKSVVNTTVNTTGDRYPLSVLDFKYDAQRYHPTQKPVALCVYMIQTYTNPNQVMLDPFAGAGSSLVAAKQLGRQAIGIELDTAYCDIIIERLKNANPIQKD